MHYADLREARKKESVAVDELAFDWEKKNMEVLHSGLTSALPNDPNTSILQIMFYFTEGHYMCRILDRLNQEKAFLEIKSMRDAFKEVEKAIASGSLRWKADRKFTRGNGAPFAD